MQVRLSAFVIVDDGLYDVPRRIDFRENHRRLEKIVVLFLL